MNRFLRIASAVALVASLTSCIRSVDPLEPTVVSFTGGLAQVYVAIAAPDVCSAAFPVRRELGERVICAEAATVLSSATRRQCSDLGLDCDALYGCDGRSIVGCETTTTTADCGGEGPPVLGCADLAGCLWFSKGCVAANYVASTCDASDACCDAEPASSGVTAFPAYQQAYSVYWFTHDHGDDFLAMDADFTLSVVSAEPSGWTASSLTCPPGAPETLLCAPPPGWTLATTVVGPSAWRVAVSHSYGWEGFLVETHGVGGVTKGRVCHTEISDFSTGVCDPQRPASPRCAESGAITLGASHGRVEFTLDGRAYVADFSRY